MFKRVLEQGDCPVEIRLVEGQCKPYVTVHMYPTRLTLIAGIIFRFAIWLGNVSAWVEA